MERYGWLAEDAASTVTRIRLVEQGRLHLQAVDDAEVGAGGARRRSRGFRPLNETVGRSAPLRRRARPASASTGVA